MTRLSKKELFVFIAATLAGACLHFVFSLLPNPVTAFFAPVNESLWEHIKIVFWPLLVAALVLTHGRERTCRGPWALAILVSCAVMLLVGYLYHVVLGGDSLVFDIILYVLVMGLAFLLSTRLDVPAVRKWADIPVFAVLALGAAILLFTFLPPDNVLFSDLSRCNTWNSIPYC